MFPLFECSLFGSPLYMVSKNLSVYTTNITTFVVLRQPVNILVSDLTNPDNLTNDLLILNYLTINKSLIKQ